MAEIPREFTPTVAAIGNFDGVHCGHQSVIAEVRRRAAALGARAVAVTFDPHPARVLRPELAPRLITPMPQRLRLLAQTGLDAVLVLPFTAALSQTSADDFARELLGGSLRALEVHEGDNFRFGRNASAGMQELAELGRQLGFAVVRHPVLRMRGLDVSSSVVRERVAAGDMGAARALLGRAFSILSTQARGRGIGTRLTVPTINLAPYHELLPADGVYVTQLRIAEECFECVSNAGTRPTFGEDSYAIESHLLNFKPIEITPETPIELSFLKRVRGERRFDSPEALRAQILRDAAYARRFLRLMHVTASA